MTRGSRLVKGGGGAANVFHERRAGFGEFEGEGPTAVGSGPLCSSAYHHQEAMGCGDVFPRRWMPRSLEWLKPRIVAVRATFAGDGQARHLTFVDRDD